MSPKSKIGPNGESCQKVDPNNKCCEKFAEQLVADATHPEKKKVEFSQGTYIATDLYKIRGS